MVVLIILSIVVQLRAIRTRCAVAFLELLNESMMDAARDYFDAATINAVNAHQFGIFVLR